MTHLFIVAAGGAIGAALRHLANTAALKLFGSGFPAGTLAINVAGSLLMGVVAGLLAPKGAGAQELRLFLATGILGGFTTFSAFSLDAVNLWQRGEGALAAAYVAGSVILSIAALVAGLGLARTLAAG
jgi:fluoride exporter